MSLTSDSPVATQVVPSPNHDARTLPVDVLILHYTGMASAGEALPTHIMGSVAFTGKVNGTLNLYFQEDFAAVCTRLLLRANEDYTKRTADTAIKDAMGEITNMSAGVFKNSLAAIGFPSRLILPKVFRCRLGSMEPGYTASRYVYHFMSAETRVVVELLIKTGP